jgi:hypothetical protein
MEGHLTTPRDSMLQVRRSPPSLPICLFGARAMNRLMAPPVIGYLCLISCCIAMPSWLKMFALCFGCDCVQLCVCACSFSSCRPGVGVPCGSDASVCLHSPCLVVVSGGGLRQALPCFTVFCRAGLTHDRLDSKRYSFRGFVCEAWASLAGWWHKPFLRRYACPASA